MSQEIDESQIYSAYLDGDGSLHLFDKEEQPLEGWPKSWPPHIPCVTTFLRSRSINFVNPPVSDDFPHDPPAADQLAPEKRKALGLLLAFSGDIIASYSLLSTYDVKEVAHAIDTLHGAHSGETGGLETFQSRVGPWVQHCFGCEIAYDTLERSHRFLEEALELVQTCGCTAQDAHQLVDYVFGRPEGEPSQEVGGVMVTLAALCLAKGLNMHVAGETELARVWKKVDAIRAKQAAKPKLHHEHRSTPLPLVS